MGGKTLIEREKLKRERKLLQGREKNLSFTSILEVEGGGMEIKCWLKKGGKWSLGELHLMSNIYNK